MSVLDEFSVLCQEIEVANNHVSVCTYSYVRVFCNK